ncbi:hemerythrin domain-containing protein [Ferrovibrio sp.]|uniref:hemerythrin domain-containing protein n=1 Tax=Ferrovibrio sp. TaxID=1917215 RepID=UPI003D2BA8BB
MNHLAFPATAMGRIETALSAPEAGLSPLDRLIGRRLDLQAFCAILKLPPVVGAGLAQALAAAAATYLSEDFLLLVAEEEDSLLPLLQRRLLLGDDMDELFRQLSDEHSQDRAQALGLAAQCQDFAAGGAGDWPDLCDALGQFAERQRRHLVWEDATIIPLARARLSEDDMRKWRSQLQTRRARHV